MGEKKKRDGEEKTARDGKNRETSKRARKEKTQLAAPTQIT